MEGTWHAPDIGKSSLPLGIDGDGTLEWSADGVRLQGSLQSQGLGSLFALVGFFCGTGLGLGVNWLLSLGSGEFVGGAAIAGIPLGVTLGRKLFPPGIADLEFPWAKVRHVRIDTKEFDGRPMLALTVGGGFFSFAKRGVAYFSPATLSCDEALRQLQAAMPSRG